VDANKNIAPPMNIKSDHQQKIPNDNSIDRYLIKTPATGEAHAISHNH
jgi:hypothetical protein